MIKAANNNHADKRGEKIMRKKFVQMSLSDICDDVSHEADPRFIAISLYFEPFTYLTNKFYITSTHIGS